MKTLLLISLFIIGSSDAMAWTMHDLLNIGKTCTMESTGVRAAMIKRYDGFYISGADELKVGNVYSASYDSHNPLRITLIRVTEHHSSYGIGFLIYDVKTGIQTSRIYNERVKRQTSTKEVCV